MICLIASETFYSQSDSLKWIHLFKHRDLMEIVQDDYIDPFWTNLSTSPVIYVDTVVIIFPSKVDNTPHFTLGLRTFIDSIKYPPIALRAGIEGKVLLNVTIDKAGFQTDVNVKWSSHVIFNQPAISSIEKLKFDPATTNGQPVDCEILIPFSFDLHRKRNAYIDQIIVDKGSCLGTCPSYTITLNADGTALYEGHQYAQKKGKWKASIEKNQFIGLSSLLFAIRFFNLPPRLATEATDFPWVTITVSTEKETKSVSTDYYLPLWEIAALVDYFMERVEWETVGE